MQPMVGQVIHRDQLELFDLTGCRLNWTAKVTRPEPDLCGAMRCSAAAGCHNADFCAAGKPHAPDPEKDGRGRCYDHDPYIVGGVVVWGTTCEANASADQTATAGMVRRDVGNSGGGQ